MTLTRDHPSTANENGALVPAGQAGRPSLTLPRSPAEALEPFRPPEPPDREPPEENSHPFLRMLDGLFTLVFIVAAVTLGIFYFMKIELDRPGPLATSTVVVVPRGEGVTAIADRLVRDGVISDRRVFMTSILYFMYLKGYGSLKAGEYQFDKHASLRQVLDTLVEGKSIEHRVTLPEGLTSLQIVQKLLAHPELEGEVTEIPSEGSLLPDTYSFGSKDKRTDVIQRMQAAQAKFLARLWEERDPSIMVKTPQEALVLASIVEKETGVADERPRIAAVFHNRLRKRMRLQSDPTIIYGLVGGQAVLDHPITQEELNRDTPYNTYKINGLPPTPIANPGRAAIEAVLKPAKTNDLYFVADGSGRHVFAPTLAEHNKNVAKWRVVEREIRAKQAQEAATAAATGAAPGAATGGPVPGTTGTGTAALVAPGTLLGEGGEAAPEAVASSAVPLPPRNPKR